MLYEVITTFKTSLFESENIPTHFSQDNHSRSSRGVLRGMHLQVPPYEQGKLVRVVRGKVVDVVVDVRVGSPSYRKWLSVELSEENKIFFGFLPDLLTDF